MKTPTPFEQQAMDIMTGKKTSPIVVYDGKEIPFTFYQINVHLHQLKLMSKGIHFRGIILRDFKEFYGLTGKTAKICVEQLTELKERYGY